MRHYPKIETLFERDKETFKVIDKIRLPEFENIKNWLVTEKIDGTNIRVIYQPGEPQKIQEEKILFRGRTDNAQMPTFLLEKLQELFTVEKFKKVIGDGEEPKQGICLYGEGYGQKIQKGGGDYNLGNSFRLFDVWIDGWWLEWDKVCEIAEMMGIKTAPVLGKHDLDKSLKLISTTIKQPITSIVARAEAEKAKKIEGIVARAYPTLLFRNGIPVKWKLKYSDY
jgi:ATP-dependent RNA circularization protein (DNA/RNA ligase family)